MSSAADTFSQSILDAENLLQHFNALNSQPPPPETEVLKRAGLIMAMTAWETYVEDRLEEAATERLRTVTEPSVVAYMQARLKEEIGRLHNPTSQKTLQLFRDFAGVDLAPGWGWNQFDPKTVRSRLDGYMKLRGDVVHRSRSVIPGPPTAHPVRKEDLEKAISFLKHLVAATEKALRDGMLPNPPAGRTGG